MKFERLFVLLPCLTLEDFPLDRSSQDAEGILSGWSALFHPALLVATDGFPRWEKADCPPDEPPPSLIVIPQCSEALLPSDWVERVEATGSAVIRGWEDRECLVAALLSKLEPPVPEFDPQWVDSFLALGYCYFQAEVLTRQLRYMSNLDEYRFREKITTAATELAKGEEQAAKDALAGAFDLLSEARQYSFPVEPHLLDLTLLAASTLGEKLRAELAGGGPVNLLLSGETLEQMAQRERETLAVLRDALQNSRASIAGGEYDERELPLLPPDAVLARFLKGLAVYERHLGMRPTVFARRRFGLSPLLPQLLRKLGFTGALHFTLDDGRFPTPNQSRIRWESLDGSAVETLTRVPVDATQTPEFLRLARKLGQTMDLDHATTALFAHWPGRASPWYDDLRRMNDFSPVLGRFRTLTDYFHQTEYVGQLTRYKADEYRSPYLRQAAAAGQADSISRWAVYYRRRLQAEAARTMQTLAHLVQPGRNTAPDDSLLDRVDDALQQHGMSASSPADGLESVLNEHYQAGRESLGKVFLSTSAKTGYLLVNPWPFPRRQVIDVSSLPTLPDVGGAVLATRELRKRKEVSVEVPSLGFAWVTAGTSTPAKPPEKPKGWSWIGSKKAVVDEPVVAEGHVLRNEFFEVKLDPVTGAIKTIHPFADRGNRFGQQLALRLPNSASGPRDLESEDDYSVMAADRLTVDSAGPLRGQITSRGRLLDRNGRVLARFVEKVGVEMGSRVIDLDIELSIEQQPGDDPWESYYAARFAWADWTAELGRSVHLTRQPTTASHLEAPLFLEIKGDHERTAILTGGNPYHRRRGDRKLDAILVARGETARRFRLGIGIDLPHPLCEAIGLLSPLPVTANDVAPASPSGWLFHVDALNVLATHWEPMVRDGRTAGYRVRLQETEGRSGQVSLRSFRGVQSAQKTDFVGSDLTPLSVEGDRVSFYMGAYEWVQVEAEFS